MLLNLSTQISAFQEENKNNLINNEFLLNTEDFDTSCEALARTKKLSYFDLLVFKYIITYEFNDKRCFVTQKTIAKKFGIRRETVNRIVRRLYRLGLLWWIQGNRKRSNIYFVAKSLLTSYAIQELRSIIPAARYAWHRILLAAHVMAGSTSKTLRSVLKKAYAVNKHLVDTITLSNDLYLKSESRSECISVEVSERARHSTHFSQKKQRNVGMQFKNAKVYEDFENNHGFTFALNAKIALDGFDSETVKQSLLQAKRLDKVNFGYIIGTLNGKYKDANRKEERSHVSLLREHFNVHEGNDKTITYDPASDNASLKTPSNGKTTAFTTFVDANGIEYWVTPDGGKLRKEVNIPKHVEDSGAEKIAYVMDNLASGEWYSKIPDRELADQSAKGLIAVGEAQERGDEDLKRQVFFQTLASVVGSSHGNIGQSLRNLAKNTANLNKEENIDPIHHAPPDLSL